MDDPGPDLGNIFRRVGFHSVDGCRPLHSVICCFASVSSATPTIDRHGPPSTGCQTGSATSLHGRVTPHAPCDRFGAAGGPAEGQPRRRPADALLQHRLPILLSDEPQPSRRDRRRDADEPLRQALAFGLGRTGDPRRLARRGAHRPAAALLSPRLRARRQRPAGRRHGLAFLPDQRDAARRGLVRPHPAPSHPHRRQHRRASVPQRPQPRHPRRPIELRQGHRGGSGS